MSTPDSEPPSSKKAPPGDASAMAKAGNIDRHTCTRTVPMRVLALGVSRTGTFSLRQALIDLGYDDCYHYSAIINENPPDADMWIEALEAKYEGKGKPFGRTEWDQLLGHCQATTDTPSTVFHRELLAAYPEVKVILTVRDSPDQWFESQTQTIMQFFEHFNAKPRTIAEAYRRLFVPFDARTVRMNELLFAYYPMYTTLRHDMQYGTTTAKDWYEDYIATIKATVPLERLLVMNVKEGWEPLCTFLDKDVPDSPFPRANERIVFHKNMQGLDSYVDSAAQATLVKIASAAAIGLAAIAFAMQRGHLSRMW